MIDFTSHIISLWIAGGNILEEQQTGSSKQNYKIKNLHFLSCTISFLDFSGPLHFYVLN